MFWLKDRMVLICANANPRIGTQYVRRSLALANALDKFGFDIHWMTPKLPVSLSRKLAFFHSHSVFESTEQIVSKVRTTSPAWTVLSGIESLPDLGDQNRVLDMGNARDCQAFVKIAQERIRLDEPKYSIACESESDDLELKVKVRRIIWIVDSDTDEKLVLELNKYLVNNSKKNYSIDLFCPSLNGVVREFAESVVSSGHGLRIHKSYDRLSSLLKLVDLVILGEVNWIPEFSLQNVPVMYLGSTSREDAFARALSRKGAIEFIDSQFDARLAQKQIVKFFNDVELRRHCCQQSFKLYDKDASDRVARAMVAAMFRFRKCDLGDGDLLLSWRNDPEIRAVSFDSDFIEPDAHYAWLRRCLASDRNVISIIEDAAGKPIGQYRLEFGEHFQDARLILGLIPSLRGMGIGTALIESASRMAMSTDRNLEVYANIKSTNVISQAAFRKAGFYPTSTLTVNGQVAVRFSMRRFDAAAETTNYEYRKAS